MNIVQKWHLWGLMVLACAGCSTSRTSHTARTSTEQLLIASAIDQSLDKVDFSSFEDCNVFLQEKYVDCVDQKYLVGSVRHRLFRAGANLVDSTDAADVVVELRSGTVGTTGAESFVGLPELTVPALVGWPEIRLIERKQQEGMAKIGIVAYDPKTNRILGDGGVSLAAVNDSNWFIGGMGPFQSGSLRREVARAKQGDSVRDPLPASVVFERPSRPDAPAEHSYASESEAEAVDQALHEESSQPEWVR